MAYMDIWSWINKDVYEKQMKYVESKILIERLRDTYENSK